MSDCEEADGKNTRTFGATAAVLTYARRCRIGVSYRPRAFCQVDLQHLVVCSNVIKTDFEGTGTDATPLGFSTSISDIVVFLVYRAPLAPLI